MFNFKVDTRSQFWNTVTGQRMEKGSWRPRFFTYFDHRHSGGKMIQWLIVSSAPEVQMHVDDEMFTIKLKPVDCEIKGMEDLAEPCTAKKLYKILPL